MDVVYLSVDQVRMGTCGSIGVMPCVAMVARAALLRSFSVAVGSVLCGMLSRAQIGKVPFGSGATPSSSTLALD